MKSSVTRISRRDGTLDRTEMSIEELKIRRELGVEVEKDLEEEIKDGICRLAMKLQGLYQQRAVRRPSDRQPNGQRKSRLTPTLSEINMSIKIMEGEATSVQIKEIKREGGAGRGRLLPVRTPKRAQDVGGKTAPPPTRGTKFDWTQSLRSGSSASGVGSGVEGNGGADVGNKAVRLEMGWKC